MIFTNSRHSRILAACVLPMGAVLRFGGDSSSETKNSTEVRDMRVVGGEGSANVSANDSSVQVFTTDHGAVSGGLGLASQAIDGAVKSGATLSSALGSMFDKALSFASDANKTSTAQVASAYGSVAAGLQDAYSVSRAPDTGILKIAAVAAVLIVGVLAYASTKRG